MNYINNSIERHFVTRLAQCTRLHNAKNDPTRLFPFSAECEAYLKEFGDEYRKLEIEIGEKYNVKSPAYKRIVKDLYAEMNALDAKFVAGKENPLFGSLDELTSKFIAAVEELAAADASVIAELAAAETTAIKAIPKIKIKTEAA